MSGMARVAGRGFVTNLGFQIVLQLVLLAQHLVIPRLLGPENVGLFALALAVVGIGASLKEFGVQEKLVQERDSDFPIAYSVAFTLELLLASVLFAVVIALAPVAAAVFGRDDLQPIVTVLAFTVFAPVLFGLPSAAYQRDLNYLAQNIVVSASPLVTALVSLALAFAGLEVWALVIGALAGLLTAAGVMWISAPMRPRLRLDGPVVRRYLRYGWPLWLSGLLGVASTWGGTFIINSVLGVAALGFFTVANSIGRRAFQIEGVIAQTLFPALCRAQDDVAGHRRAFVATNRITVLWAGPLGFGLAVFAGDVTALVLGDAWIPATFLLRMQGLALVVGSIGFSWDVFFRARGTSTPTLAGRIVGEGWVFLVLLPALVLWGLDGAAWALLTFGALAVSVRQFYLRKLFPGINLLANASRELVATALAAGVTALVRAATGPPRSIAAFALLVGVFVIANGITVFVADRHFIADLYRRVRGRGATIEAPADETGGRDHHRGPSSEPELEMVAVPGKYPFFAAEDGDAVWITLRDSSSLARLDADGQWKTWRLPPWPHIPTIDRRGRAWVALTLSSGVAVVDPNVSGGWERIKLRKTRELLGAAWADDLCFVVDSGHRCVWRIGDTARDALPLPAEVIRPDVIAVADGTLWVSDTEMPALIALESDEDPRLVPVSDGSRGLVVDPAASALWVGHTRRTALTRLSLATRSTEEFELPGVPFGIAIDGTGRVAAALTAEDSLAIVSPDGHVESIALPPGSRPTSVVRMGAHWYVTCAALNQLAILP